MALISKGKFGAIKVVALCATVIAVSLFNLNTAYAADFPALQGYGMNTIAGYSTLLSTSKTFPGRNVVFSIVKPDGASVNIDAITGSNGVAKADLYDYHTRKAGKYSVSAYFSDESGSGSQPSYFEVYPDTVSQVTSALAVEKNVARADGNDKVHLTVALKDKYGNPFSGHVVNLISSRASDSADALSQGALTDFNGVIGFSVSSYESGVSVFSAVDATSGVILAGRVKVAFLSQDDFKDQMGGYFDDLIPIASAQSSGSLASFEIFGIPTGISANENLNFTVRAVDQNQLTVENYTGSVHFSAEGENSINVTLPEDYRFKAEDLGVHEFSLGLKFATDGNYTIVVTDITNQQIQGKKDVVVGGNTGTQGTGSTGSAPTVISPVAGSYSLRTQSVNGTAPVGSVVKVFDNSSEIGTVQTDLDGNFTFASAPLIDGKHSIYVSTVDNSGLVKGTSASVDIVIDNTPPTVDEVVLEPETGITPGSALKIIVLTEPDLSQAALIFANDIYEMQPDILQPGAYSVELSAPATAGEYSVDVVVSDVLGNEDTIYGAGTVIVSGEAVVSNQEEPGTTDGGLPPSQVFGVLAYGSNGRVTLVWEAANDDTAVGKYKVYYGMDPVNLDSSVETSGSSTTWYVPNLENGKEYYFAVSAIDDGGVESLQRSEIVNAIPFSLEVESTLPVRPDGTLGDAIDGEAYLRGASLEGLPPETTDNGPELIWLLAVAGGLGGLRKFRKRK